MDIHELFGIISGLIFAAGAIPYIIDILRGNTRPNVATWLGWALLLIIGSAAQLAQGASWSVLLPIAGVLSDGFILALAFRRGHIRFSPLDKTCLALGALALIAWALTREPLVALLLAIFADAVVATPTIVKSYRAPSSESSFGWFLYTLGSCLAISAAATPDVNNLAWPIYLTISNGIILVLSFRKRETVNI